jgi:competence protein ComEC
VLTGDAEEHTERAMIQRGHELQAQVLQRGHHGSRTSSSLAFLQAIQPEIAIYSAAEGNQYGHPHAVVIERLDGLGIPVYGTDQHGTIRIVTDGETYQVEVAVEVEPESVDQPVEIVVPTDDDGCQPGQVDINTADHATLQQIIHIGPQRATALIQLRPFASVDDLVRISGIAAGRLADIKEQGLACVR